MIGSRTAVAIHVAITVPRNVCHHVSPIVGSSPKAYCDAAPLDFIQARTSRAKAIRRFLLIGGENRLST